MSKKKHKKGIQGQPDKPQGAPEKEKVVGGMLLLMAPKERENNENPMKSDEKEVTREEKQEQDRTRINKKLFIGFFPGCKCVISLACAKTGINPDTFYEWREKDPEFAEAIKKATVHTNEQVVDVLMGKILIEKDGPSVRYYLDRKHPEYTPKNKLDHTTGGLPLETKITVVFKKYG